MKDRRLRKLLCDLGLITADARDARLKFEKYEREVSRLSINSIKLVSSFFFDLIESNS